MITIRTEVVGLEVDLRDDEQSLTFRFASKILFRCSLSKR